MKGKMRDKFFPSDYRQTISQKFQNLKQQQNCERVHQRLTNYKLRMTSTKMKSRVKLVTLMVYTSQFKRWSLQDIYRLSEAYIHARRIESNQSVRRSKMPKMSSSSIGRTQFRNIAAQSRIQTNTSQAPRQNPNEL